MNEFNDLLRFFRKSKQFSQLDLSSESGISTKHLSFLETGRSKPSRHSILLISKALDLPIHHQNMLLTSSGHTEDYTRLHINDKNRVGLINTLEVMLGNHEPYPAAVLDWNWNLMLSNKAFQYLIDHLKMINPSFSTSENIVELIFDPQGFKPFIKNWLEVSKLSILRLHHEQLKNKDRHTELLKKIKSHYQIPYDIYCVDISEIPDPSINIELSVNSMTLKLLTTLSSFGTSIDVTSDEIMIEHYFPADEETKLFFNSINNNAFYTISIRHATV